MKQYLNSDQTAKLIELGFDRPKGWCVEGISSRLIMYKHKEDDEGFNYSIGELIEMLPSYVEWEGNYYHLRIETECTYSWTVSYEPNQNDKARIFPVYDGGSCLIDILYNVLINLVAFKDEFTDTGGHDEYNQGEVLSEVFKLKEEGVI